MELYDSRRFGEALPEERLREALRLDHERSQSTRFASAQRSSSA
jgi:hypothetical protein